MNSPVKIVGKRWNRRES